jgi:polyisoprenoid-binding protein YceI
MRRAVAAALILAACATSEGVQAQTAPVAPGPVVASAPVTYALDPAHTQVVFSVERFGFSRVVGFFDDVSGEVVLDEAHPERSSVRATIPVASLDTGNPERDGFLRGEFWLKGGAFPNIEFRCTSVRLVGERQAEVTGELSVAGVTAPATMMVTLNNLGPDPHTRRQAAGFSATGSLMRATYGVRTAPPIGNEVRFSIEAFALASSDSP